MRGTELNYIVKHASDNDDAEAPVAACDLFQDAEDDFETDEEYRLAYGPPTLKVISAGPVLEAVETSPPIPPVATNAPAAAAEVIESTEFTRNLEAAACISVVRCRTVTPLEFFFNIYVIFKTIITTFLSLPGMATILSMLGVDQITSSIPYLDQTIELLENILKLLLLVGSKAAYKVELKDTSGNVTYSVRGVVPKPKSLCTKLFPAGRHIQILFKDAAGQPVITYDMPKKPMCGKRRGAKICAGEVNGKVTKKAIDAGEVKVLGTAAKPGFCTNICKLRKVVAKGGAAQIRIPWFFTWSGWPNKGQMLLNPYVEVQPAGAGIKMPGGTANNTVAPAPAGLSTEGNSAKVASWFDGPKTFWAQVPLPIIASTFSIMSDVASEVGLGEVLDTALAVQGSSVQGAAAVKVDAAAAAEAAKAAMAEAAKAAVRLRNILTLRCNLAPDGEYVREFPIQERLDLISGMIWLDYSFCLKTIPS